MKPPNAAHFMTFQASAFELLALSGLFAYELWQTTKAFHLPVLIGSQDEQTCQASLSPRMSGEGT